MACFGKKSSLIAMILLTSSFFLVEIIVGYLTKSMALVADSFHMLSDVASLFVGFFAVKISQHKHQSAERNTFGWVRAEVLGALVNAVFLIALCFSIFIESMTRFVETVRIENPILVLIVGSLGLLVNLLGMCLFHGHAHGHSHGHNHSHGAHNDMKTTAITLVPSENEHTCQMERQGKDLAIAITKEERFSFRNKGFAERSPPLKRKATATEFEDGISITDDKPQQHVSIDLTVTTANEGNEVVILEASTSSGGDSVMSESEVPAKHHHQSQMNMRGVYLHVLGDALGSVIVIISALIVHFVDSSWVVYIDPSMSILLVLIILKSSIPLLKESSLILLQTVPTHIEMQALKSKLLVKFPLIKSVHDFHIWQLAGSKIIASLHVKVFTQGDYMTVCESLKQFFHNEGIHSTTIQPEFIEDNDEDEETSDLACLLECSSVGCEESKCCQADGAKRLSEVDQAPTEE